MTRPPILAIPLLTCLSVAGCAAGTIPASTHAVSAAHTATTSSSVARTTATPSPTSPVASASPGPPAPTLTPPPAAASSTSRPHGPVSACRLLTGAQVTSIAGRPLAPDSSLSGVFDSFTANDGLDYVQDDCGYSSGEATVRVLVVEPTPPHRGTVADGREALQVAEDDMTSHGATLTPVPGLGDAAASWAPAGQGFAQVYVLDHEIVVGVGIEGVTSGDALGKAEQLAHDALAAADSGAATGVPGS